LLKGYPVLLKKAGDVETEGDRALVFAS